MREEFAVTAARADHVPTPGPSERPAAVTRATGGGGAMRFLTDIIVELGFAPRERVEQAVLAAREAGVPP